MTADQLCIDNKRDIRLGDVVVGLPHGSTPGVLQYDLGKVKQDKEWERTGSLNQPPTVLLSVVQYLKSGRDKISGQMQTLMDKTIEKHPGLEEEFKHQNAAGDRLFAANYLHRTGSPDCSRCESSNEISRPTRKSNMPAVHYGVILSGNRLMKNAKERDKIARLTKQDCICFEMEAAGIVSQLPCLVIRGICDYADSHKNDVWQPYASATAAAYAKLLIYNVDPQVLARKELSGEVASFLAPVSASVEKLHAHTARIEQSCEIVATVAELEVLSRLPISAQARYDSLEEGDSPLCLPGTRKDVLKKLSDWLEKERSRILCLNGMAGTGKSTIARSFAKSLHNDGQLGASFFFQRDDSERGRVQTFSSTIAVDLADRFPDARASVVDTVKRFHSIAHTEAKEQFQLLVLDPLSKVTLKKTIAIVIDAVDECDGTDLESLFALVSAFQKAELPGVKLFFTSRPDLAVLKEFDTETYKCATIALQEVPISIIDHDIGIFLKHKLREVRKKYNLSVGGESEGLGPNWPSREDEEKLLKMSNRLFIFAATICRLLEDDSMSSPDVQLRDLLELKTTTGHKFERIYLPVLNRQIPTESDFKEELIRECKYVLGAICVLCSPISVPALARLLGLDFKDIERRLRNLQSVIEVIRPKDSTSKEKTRIRLLHRSFREFLLSKKVRQVSPIWVDEQEAHHIMMNRCLETLKKPNTGLRFNICGLDLPGTPRRDVRPERLESCFTQDLAYACRHLTEHAVLAKFKITDGDEIHQFLLSHLLHWLEAWAYLGNHRNPARDLLRLKSLAGPNKKSKEVVKFLKDAYRFAAAHWKSLDQAPLQIYTALIFTPKNSIVRRTFEHKYNAWVLQKPAVDYDWNMGFTDITVEPLPVQGILKLLFSPNKRILAAMSLNVVWFMSYMGEQFFFIPIDNPFGDGASPPAVVFSSNSKLIALRNGNDEIEIWNTEEGSPKFGHRLWRFKAEYEADYFYRPRSFTHNDSCVLIPSRHFADIWSIESGTVGGTIVNTIQFPTAAHEVAVSPDCSILAGHFDDGLIFWNIETGRPVRWTALPTENRAPSYDLVLSSNNSAWIIAKEGTGNQEVYSATSDGPRAFLQEENNAYTISEDYLVVVYEDEIRIWKHGNKCPQAITRTRPGPVTTIAHSGTQLVSSATDDIAPGVIFFYKLPRHQPRDTEFSPCLEDSEYGDEFSENFINSPNGTMLASIGPNGARIVSARPSSPSVVKHRSLMEKIAFSWTGDLFTTSNGKVLYLWKRTGNLDPALLSYYDVDQRYDVDEEFRILSANFSLDAYRILVVIRGKDGTDLVFLEVPSLKHMWKQRIRRFGVYDAVFSPDNRLWAVIEEDEVNIWDASVWILKIDGKVNAVQISPDSTLALLIRPNTLEVWHIRRGTCLYSAPRRSISDATFDRMKQVILTNCGKLAYHIVCSTIQVQSCESGPKTVLLPDYSGDSLAATPEKPLIYLALKLERIGWGIATDGTWITWHGQNWIRLPTDYCARHSAVDGNRVLIMNEADVETRYEFADDPIFQELSNDVDVEMTDCEQCVAQGLGIMQYLG